jgi:hypothetical protein
MEQPLTVSRSPYVQLLSKVVDMTSKVTKDTLTFYWELGASVNELEGDSRHDYGNKTVETFARDLLSNGVDLSTSSLYKAATFNKNCSKEELQKLIDGKWSWRNAVMLFSNSTKPEIRKQILSRVASNEITQDKTKDILRGDETEKTTVRGLSFEAENLADVGRSYCSKLETIPDLALRLRQLPIAERRNHLQSVASLRSELENLMSNVKSKLKALDAIKF